MTKENIRLIDPYDKNLAEQYKTIFKKLGLTKAPTGAYTIRFLEVNDRPRAIEDLLEFRKNDINDLKKLLRTLKEQLSCNDLIRDTNKLYIAKNKILEFKAQKGHARLFGFLSGETGNKEIIICSHGYWKTDGKRNNEKQQAAFRLANKFRLLYMNNQG